MLDVEETTRGDVRGDISMSKHRSTVLVLAAAAVGIGAAAPVARAEPADPGATTLASVSTSGLAAIGRYSTPSLGFGLGFSSTASDLDGGDTNGVADIFLRDSGYGGTNRIPAFTGIQFNGPSSEPEVAGVVVFSSRASDIVSGDTNGVQDVFLHWEEGGSFDRYSVSNTGAQANGASSQPAVSGGSFQFDPVAVAFTSVATNLVPGDTNGRADVFVRGFNDAPTTRVSVASDEGQADTGASSEPAVSGNGQFVAFTSTASDLVPGDTNGTADVFVRDLTAGTTTRVSVGSTGGQATGASSQPTISADGRYVAFASTDAGLAGGPPATVAQIYVRDLTAGTTRRVSVSSSAQPGNGASSQPALSAGGDYVVFTSAASNLVAGDTNAHLDVFLRDLNHGTTTRESVSSNGTQSRSDSHSADVNSDGSVVVFLSEAHGGLISGDNTQTILWRMPQAPPTPFGDFDMDGLSDVVARTTTGELRLYRGTGTGFAPPLRIGASGWGGMDAITRHGDFDLDGREDVIAREKATGTLWLYPGRRTSFAPRLKVGASGWNGMREITAVGDFNKDAKADIVAVQNATGDLYLYPGRGTGFGPRRLIGHGGWNGMDELTGVGDYNDDGNLDLVARQPSTADLWLYPGTATGTSFLHRQRIGLLWNGMRDLTGVGDFDRDGAPDIAAIRKSVSRLEVARTSVPGFTSVVSPIL